MTKKRGRGHHGGHDGARQGSGSGYAKWFTHHKTGKRYYCEDYGLKAWPIGGGGKKKR